MCVFYATRSTRWFKQSFVMHANKRNDQKRPDLVHKHLNPVGVLTSLL